MEQLKLSEATELDKLAREINGQHKLAIAGVMGAAEHAWECGRLLIKAQMAAGARKFAPWIEANFEGTRQTAYDYIGVAKKYPDILSVRRALQMGAGGIRGLLGKSAQPTLQSESNEWYTPSEYIAAVYEVMGGIDLDPATCKTANETVRATKFYTADDDGLKQDWSGRVFLNPPYGKLCHAFIERLCLFLGSSVPEAIVLVNANSTDTDWYQPLFAGLMCFTDHRINFNSPDGQASGSTHGSCFVYFGPNMAKFAAVFAQFGNVVRRWPNE